MYRVSRSTGQIVWRLGGKRSDFAMGPGTTFGYQHDARLQADGTYTLFDDGSAPGHSRAIVLRLDETAMTATLVHEYRGERRLVHVDLYRIRGSGDALDPPDRPPSSSRPAGP